MICEYWEPDRIKESIIVFMTAKDRHQDCRFISDARAHPNSLKYALQSIYNGGFLYACIKC